jgi:hypothetical protein
LPINSTMVQELADQQHLGDLGRHHLQAAAHPPTSVQPSNNGQVPGSIPFSVGWNLLLHRCFHNARPPGLWSQSYWTGYLYCQYSGKSPSQHIHQGCNEFCFLCSYGGGSSYGPSGKVLDILQLQQGTILSNNQ